MKIEKISIIGLGLIGGSLGLALKQARGTDIEIIGFARRPEVATEAVRRGAVDKTVPMLAQAVSGVDVVVVATHLMAVQEVFREIAGNVSPNTIVTDVGSTKAQVLRWAAEYLPSTVYFIGGHPMSGKETSGLNEAEAGLFKDCAYCFTPSESTGEHALSEMQQLAKSIGAKPIVLNAEDHDQLVAGISHLPLLLSSTLVTTLSESPLWPEMSRLAATGYLDMTRLASGDPELHRGICITNQSSIIDWIDRYIEALQQCRRLVLSDDQGLQHSLNDAREARKKWLNNEGHRFKK